MSLLRVLKIPELMEFGLGPHLAHEDIVRLSRCCCTFYTCLRFLLRIIARHRAALRLQRWALEFTTPFTSGARFTLILGVPNTGKSWLHHNVVRSLVRRGIAVFHTHIDHPELVGHNAALAHFGFGQRSLVITSVFDATPIPQHLLAACDKLLICGPVFQDHGALQGVGHLPLFQACLADRLRLENLMRGASKYTVLMLSATTKTWTLFDVTRHPAYSLSSVEPAMQKFPGARYRDRPRVIGRGMLNS